MLSLGIVVFFQRESLSSLSRFVLFVFILLIFCQAGRAQCTVYYGGKRYFAPVAYIHDVCVEAMNLGNSSRLDNTHLFH